MLLGLLACGCLALCIYGALTDIASLTIPNWVNGAIAALGLVAIAASGLPLSEMGLYLLIGVIAFVISFVLFSFGLYGGGDAKMIPAVVLWLGPVGLAPFLFGMAFVGGAIALVGLCAKYAPLPEGSPVWITNVLSKGEGLPYGVAIAAGALLATPHAPLLAKSLAIVGGG